MRFRSIRGGIGCSAALALLFCAPLRLSPQQPPDRLAQFKSQFERESDPVRKAKILIKLSEAEFQHIRSENEAGNTENGLKLLEEFRDQSVSTHDALKAKGVNPERKSAGYKELEISVRESLHRLREILAGLSGDDQKNYAKVRAQLEQLNNELIRELFPRQPGAPGQQSTPKP